MIDPFETTKTRHDERLELVRKLKDDNPTLSVRTIARRLSIPRSTVQDLICELETPETSGQETVTQLQLRNAELESKLDLAREEWKRMSRQMKDPGSSVPTATNLVPFGHPRKFTVDEIASLKIMIDKADTIDDLRTIHDLHVAGSSWVDGLPDMTVHELSEHLSRRAVEIRRGVLVN
jgi:hypothetical protein